MNLGKKKKENLVAIDVGSSSIKLMELDLERETPKVLSVGMVSTPAESVSNNSVGKVSNLADGLKAVVEKSGATNNKVALSIPGPAAFTKTVVCNYSTVEDLKENIAFEAGNYIPHKIESVYFDYQVLRKKTSSSLEVLLVAVKQDVVEGYLRAATSAGLEPLLLDIDVFAAENMLETALPERADETVALVNIGSRYSTVSIMENGRSLFVGDVSVGGKKYNDAISEAMSLGSAEAHRAKHGEALDNVDKDLLTEILDQTSGFIATELQRQIGFFWSAAEAQSSISKVYLCGGGAQVAGFVDVLAEKVGMECLLVDPCSGLDLSGLSDKGVLDSGSTSFGVCAGLALRRLGDKQHNLNEK